jgi:8-oxoguanine deaminase
VSTLFANAHVVTMDDGGAEYPDGWIHIDDGNAAAVGSGSRPDAEEVHDLDGAVVTPGLVNTHPALTARDALRLATRGGAAVLGRDDIGELSPGRRADLAVWRTDRLELGGASDPVAGLVLASPHRVDRLYVGGEEIVSDGHLVRGDEEEIAREQRRQAERFAA